MKGKSDLKLPYHLTHDSFKPAFRRSNLYHQHKIDLVMGLARHGIHTEFCMKDLLADQSNQT
jgi:hypothetical protein